MAIETIEERADEDVINGNGKRQPSNTAETTYAKRANNNDSNQTGETYCSECKILFIRRYTFRRHMDDIHGATSRFECDQEDCDKSFTRKDTLSRHKDMQHGGGKVPCLECGKSIRKDGLRDHQMTKLCLDNRRTICFGESLVRNASKAKNLVRTAQEMHVEVETELEAWMYAEAASQLQSTVQVADKMGLDPEVTSLDRPGVTIEDATLLDPRPVTVRIVPETNVHSAPSQLSSYLIHANCTPEIVPDSPRPVGQAFSLSTVFLNDDQNADDLASDVETRRVALEKAGGFANPVAANPQSAEFLQTSEPSRRFYNMSLGSECALCEQPLGHSLKSIAQHAKSHLQLRDQPKLECLKCKIDFAFEIDLKLHSSKLELWSFCREMPPVDAHDNSDWVANSTMQDRASFINLLRQWESLQIHWYLGAIEKLLTRLALFGVRSRTEISVPVLRLRDCRGANTTVLSVDNAGISVLIRRFGETKLDNVSNEKSLNYRGSRRHDNILLARQRLWEMAGTSAESFGEALAALRFHCEDDAAYKKILQIALYEASSKGDITMIEKLLDAGVEIDALDDYGFSALLRAVERKQIRSARLLIERGADVDHRCVDGYSVLQHACLRKFRDIAHLLIAYGAKTETRLGDRKALIPTCRARR